MVLSTVQCAWKSRGPDAKKHLCCWWLSMRWSGFINKWCRIYTFSFEFKQYNDLAFGEKKKKKKPTKETDMHYWTTTSGTSGLHYWVLIWLWLWYLCWLGWVRLRHEKCVVSIRVNNMSVSKTGPRYWEWEYLHMIHHVFLLFHYISIWWKYHLLAVSLASGSRLHEVNIKSCKSH